MTPPTLFLSAAPIPGTAYALTPIIGGMADCTAVYRGMVHREETVRTAKSVFYSHYDLAQFVDEETGEILEFEVEIGEAVTKEQQR